MILDRRLELTAMRKDGTEFPVELTITKIALPGPPTFTGYLRDITDRVKAEQALRASRARLVEVADEERKRIQRNLHDGAQQRLTAVLLTLSRLRESPERPGLLQAAIDELARGLEDPRASGGLHPSVLAERGLGAALEALSLSTPMPVALDVDLGEALPEPVEAAAYYVVAESIANVHKHAGASSILVRLHRVDGRLVVEVNDDGIGGAGGEGSGLRGLADRVEALGGSLTLDSPPGSGTRLTAEIPLG